MTDLVVLLVVLPLGGAAAALAAKLPTIARRPAAVRTLTLLTPVMLLAGAVALGFSYSAVNAGGIATYALGGWPVPLGIGLRLDGLAWLSSALVYGLSFLISLYIVSHREYGTEFYFFFMLLVAGMEGVVLTTDVFNMFVSFEIIAISAYVLIAYHREGTALVASFKYLILSSVGIFFFLFGVFVIYRELGTLALADIGPLYRAVEDPVRLRTLRFALVALVVGVGVRTAFIPFHTWLPEAHAYAPHPISALLSGVLIKVSFFAMVRIITVFDPMIFARLLLWIGAITAIVAVIWALSQRDVKKLLAYHSISQMGYVLAAIGAAGGVAAAAAGPGDLLAAGTVGNPLALPASVYHALNHGLFKSLLFLAVGTAVYLTGERDVYRMPGVGRRAPILAVLFAVGALSIAGVPGFNGYASKVAISTALDGSPAYLLLRLTAIGTAASFIKLSRVFRGGPAQEGAAPNGATPDGAGARAVPAVATVGMAIIAVLCVATGLAPHTTLGALHGLLTRSTVVGGGGLPAMSPAFAPTKLLETAIILVLGGVLYRLTQTTHGGRVSHRIEAIAPSLRTVLLFFFAGVVGFALVAAAA